MVIVAILNMVPFPPVTINCPLVPKLNTLVDVDVDVKAETLKVKLFRANVPACNVKFCVVVRLSCKVLLPVI